MSAGFFVGRKEAIDVKRRKTTRPAKLSQAELETYKEQIGTLAAAWAKGLDEALLMAQYRALRLDQRIGRAVYLSYSDQELLDALRETARRVGRAPVQKEVFFLYRSYLKARFRTWPGALEAAGMRRLPASTLPPQDWPALVSREHEICRLLEELSALQRQKGTPPRRREFSQAERLRQRFGPWENVLAAAQAFAEWKSKQQNG